MYQTYTRPILKALPHDIMIMPEHFEPAGLSEFFEADNPAIDGNTI